MEEKNQNVNGTNKIHTVSIEQQKRVRLTGITGVVALTEKEADLTLSLGRLIITGNKLTADKLDIESGVLTLTADSILGMQYLTERKKSKGIFRRL
ncbi:MAG: YabP/YqfC family sporulation protein [Clostridia bacterium]|nr:YabP/YqfC family sporulation protein [Clostridia bacterium]